MHPVGSTKALESYRLGDQLEKKFAILSSHHRSVHCKIVHELCVLEEEKTRLYWRSEVKNREETLLALEERLGTIRRGEIEDSITPNLGF